MGTAYCAHVALGPVIVGRIPMNRTTPAAVRGLLLVFVLCFAAPLAAAEDKQPAAAEKPLVPGGELQILGKDGKPKAYCPLKRTDVTADVAGFIARVKVKQTFHNPSDEKVEAVYVF